jgi:flavin reductase (DIM6/NTAB) family NADH-FMN oxidoreductase RutF
MEKSSKKVRDFMASLARHVVVLSVADEKCIHGFTISSLTSLTVSEEGPQVVFTIRKDSFFGSKLGNLPFGISVLSETQSAESEQYARPRKPAPLLQESGSWSLTDRGVPLLRGAVSSAVGEVTKVFDFGENNLFVATLCQPTTSVSGRPLIYSNRRYCKVQEIPLEGLN